MQITKKIHAIKIPFKVPVSPELSVERFAFVYLIFGDKIHLIDSGVAGADSTIWEYIKALTVIVSYDRLSYRYSNDDTTSEKIFFKVNVHMFF